ncbi:hypothetical protein ACFWRZ_09085 [Streptomyces rubiginosohelvolus]|uniref:hypothetical protein n=1 Tax=Streptomyces rubiginosohelvolus TaxID=67362 RepID=UPI0036532DEA
MNSSTRTDLHNLITAAQSAVRDAETYGSPDTLRGVDKALCEFPVTDMDTAADRGLHAALRAVGNAEDAEEWTLLTDVEHQVSRLLHEPDGATLEHPAVRAVVLLTSQCGSRYGEKVYDPTERRRWYASPVRRAWNRAYLLGLEALRELTSAIGGSDNGRALDKAMVKFLASVRRAIPYTALIETRRALVEAARTYGLFVIGMRQPMPVDGRWEWARRIGAATFLFEMEPPMPGGDPYGAVAVRRVAEDGTASPVRYIPLGPDETRRRAAAEALYRI